VVAIHDVVNTLFFILPQLPEAASTRATSKERRSLAQVIRMPQKRSEFCRGVCARNFFLKKNFFKKKEK
jgi:hypothetical protein